MSAKLNEMRQKRAACTAKARELAEKAENENRDMSAEEKSEVDKWLADHKTLSADIERLEAIEAAERGDSQLANSPASVAAERQPGDRPDERMEALRVYMRDGVTALNDVQKRALQADAATGGGYLVPPQQWVSELIQDLKKRVFIRGLARSFTVPNAESLGAPSLNARMGDATWTAELLTGDFDTSLSFGKRELRPHPLARKLLVSKPLIRKSVVPVDALVREEFSYMFGRVMENAYLNGNGNNQPLGIFTASNDGVSTSQDSSTSNTTTALTYDGLIEALFKMQAEYRPGARWLFHDDAVKMLIKIKDGNGRYIWLDSIRDGEQNTLLGHPVDVSDLVPHTFTTALYVGALCNWQHYWIADALSFELQVLLEKYAETNQVAYIGRAESDAMPVNQNGFVRVKLA